MPNAWSRRGALAGLTGILLTGAAHRARAGADAGLYDRPPPPGAAFLRVAVDPPNVPDMAAIGATVLALTPNGISDYVVVPKARTHISAGTERHDVTLTPGGFFTARLGRSGAIDLLTDPPLTDLSKAALYLYNFAARPAGLAAPRLGATIFDAVAPGAVTMRPVNAITLDLAVAVDGVEVATFSDVRLERRQGLSVFITASDGGVRADLVTGRVLTG